MAQLKSGEMLGPYEILSAIGAGGMGEVYRARDTRLDRTVAIKVLPAHLSQRPDLRDRFEREARLISSLNDAHICTLFDIGSYGGVEFLVMEYLEGETLAERLEKGPLPLDQALTCAIQIAGALDRAHRQGVTHRDLKPGNIMLTRGGAKLMDFGLAKAAAQGAEAAELSSLPTKADISAQGTILGTLQYMSPEQLGGENTDARTDIFSFGATLYEAITGRKAFAGKNQASLIAAIMHLDPPPVSTLQPITPPALDRIVRVCLAKDPAERWQNAGDLRRELEWISKTSSGGVQSSLTATTQQRRTVAQWWKAAAIAAALLAVGAAVFAGMILLRPERTPVIRFTVDLPENSAPGFGLIGEGVNTEDPNGGAISPDGATLLFVAPDSAGRSILWTRPLDSLEFKPLPGTDGASFPFWSPDSRFIGFFAQGKVKKIAVGGGPPTTICDAEGLARGGTWNNQGVILFASVARRVILKVAADGGQPTAVTKQSNEEPDQRFPHFLPDGRHFLYLVRGKGTFLGAIDSNETRLVVPSDLMAVYAAGHILIVRGETLLAQPFDADRLQLTGEAVTVAHGIGGLPILGAGAFSASNNGILTFRLRGQPQNAAVQLAWLDRTGRMIGTLGPAGEYESMALSPDEKRLAFTRSNDIWLSDLEGKAPFRFTFGPSSDTNPAFSPDGLTIVYSLGSNLFKRPSNGGSPEQALTKDGTGTITDVSYSPDGKTILFSQFNSTGTDVMVFGPGDGQRPVPFFPSPFTERWPRFSPAGNWVAYTSNETGRFEVYVQPYPATGTKWQVSFNGGSRPAWRQDGKELFFLSEDLRLYSAVIRSTIRNFEFEAPQGLFDLRSNVYIPSRDGQRFLAAMPSTGAGQLRGPGSSPLSVVVNWAASLRH